MTRSIPLLILIALASACGGEERGVPRDAPPAAAMVAPGLELEVLDRQLAELAGELERARDGETDRLLTAEAISDRLLDAERAVDWLASGYDVEARLRQLQAMADRVLARLRRGATVEGVSDDVAVLVAAVADLRNQLAAPGGGNAPPTLDSLLAQDPLRDVEAPSLRGVRAAQDSADAARPPLPDIEPVVAPVQSGPLGTPVTQPDTTPGR